MKRRDLLKAAAILPALTFAGRLYAAPAAKARLLVVFLRGAYDAANIVIPVSSDFYYQTRPHLAIPKPGFDANCALPLDADWALHPALKDTIYPLYQKNQIAFVPFAGTDDASRSHFETQDTIELGLPLTGTRDYKFGFMHRLNSVLSDAAPIAFTTQLPLIFRGNDSAIPNIALDSTGKGLDPRNASLIQSMYAGSELAPAVSEGFKVHDEVYQAIAVEMQAANRGAVSTKGFELAAQRIGMLMRDKFNLGFVDVGGWDTHINQGGAQGYLADRISELSRGLSAFAAQMEPVWNDTVVVVISEFGRTFRENGNRGTDHGHGSVYWVLGGGVKGGRLCGDMVRVEQATLFQDRDYPVLNEYRAVLAGLFARMYGLRDEQIQRIFPSVTAKDLALI